MLAGEVILETMQHINLSRVVKRTQPELKSFYKLD